MPVSKRTRFEVLRRDSHTCRYCRATDQPLTIDHVVPVTLGGSDAPENLVAACRDCNAGKSSSSPDATIVADVSDDAIRWAEAMQEVIEDRRAKAHDRSERLAYFRSLWVSDLGWAQLPHGWEDSILRFLSLGVSTEEMERAIGKIANHPSISGAGAFRYFCGICWAIIREIEAGVSAILAGNPKGDDGPLTTRDCDVLASVILQLVVDGQTSRLPLEWRAGSLRSAA